MTFDQFNKIIINVKLQIKNINFFKIILLTPNFWIVTYT